MTDHERRANEAGEDISADVASAERGERAIFLAGNVSEGFVAYGPYEDINTCAAAHDCEEGWMMTLLDPKEDAEQRDRKARAEHDDGE